MFFHRALARTSMSANRRTKAHLHEGSICYSMSFAFSTLTATTNREDERASTLFIELERFRNEKLCLPTIIRPNRVPSENEKLSPPNMLSARYNLRKHIKLYEWKRCVKLHPATPATLAEIHRAFNLKTFRFPFSPDGDPVAGEYNEKFIIQRELRWRSECEHSVISLLFTTQPKLYHSFRSLYFKRAKLVRQKLSARQALQIGDVEVSVAVGKFRVHSSHGSSFI